MNSCAPKSAKRTYEFAPRPCHRCYGCRGCRSSVDCTVCSLSDASASLRIVTTAGVSEIFKLLIEADGLSRKCQIVAKADQMLDVAFV